jgi:hypothetical protein
VSAWARREERAIAHPTDRFHGIDPLVGSTRDRVVPRFECPLLVAPPGESTEQPIDTATAAGKCFLDMLGVFAEFETNLRRERQLEGIAKAKAAGVYKGRPASIDATQVRAMKAQGLGASEIAKALKIGRASAIGSLPIRSGPANGRQSAAERMERARVAGPDEVFRANQARRPAIAP